MEKPEIVRQSQMDEELRIKLSELHHHQDIRHYFETQVVREDGIIIRLNNEIDTLKKPKRETQLDLPELHLSFRERLLQGLESILDRVTPS